MPQQPRTFVDLLKVRELADSISSVGQAQAGIVRPLDSPDEQGRIFELISGERRYRACLMANIGFFRAEIDRTPMTPAQQFLKALTTNSDMEPLSPTENALAIQRLKAMGLTDEQICKVMSRSSAWVGQHYSFLKLTPKVFALMGPEIPEESRLGPSTAILLVKVPEEYQIALANDIISRKLSMVQARHLVESTMRSRGIRGPVRRPDKQFRTFATFIRNTADQLDALLDTPANVLRVMLIDTAGLQERMRILEVIDSIAKTAPELKTQIDQLLVLTDAQRIRERHAMIQSIAKIAEGFPLLQAKLNAILITRGQA